MFDNSQHEDVQNPTADRHLIRSLSNEELDKICRIIVPSRTSTSNRAVSPRSRNRKLSLLLFGKKI